MKDGGRALRAVKLQARRRELDCACGEGQKQETEPKKGELRGALPPALPKWTAGGGGEADNELTARRSTAARSANHKHSLWPSEAGSSRTGSVVQLVPSGTVQKMAASYALLSDRD